MEENPEEGFVEKWTDEDLSKIISIKSSKESDFIRDNKEIQEAEELTGSNNIGIDMPKYLQKIKSIF